MQRRALFALSALLRGNTKEQINFIKNYRGLNILGKSFSGRSLQVQLKAVVLLTDFINHEVGVIVVSTDYATVKPPVKKKPSKKGHNRNIFL